jgi:hypothetical protein
MYREEKMDYERSLVEDNENIAEALKHLQSKTWKKQARADIAEELNNSGMVPLYTQGFAGGKPEWKPEGIQRYNELCLLVTVNRHEDEARPRSVEDRLKREWIKEAKEEDIDIRGKKRSPVDESGNWRGKERAADIACIDLEEVKDDIDKARKRMRLFIQNNPGDIDPRIKEWTRVDVEVTEGAVEETT